MYTRKCKQNKIIFYVKLYSESFARSITQNFHTCLPSRLHILKKYSKNKWWIVNQ